MLKQGNVARALSWSGFAAACGVGAILLSIAPTFADDTNKTPTAEKPEATQTATSSASVQSTAPVPVQTRVEAVTTATESAPVTVSVAQAAPAAPEAPGTPPAPGSISFTPAPPAAGSSDSAPASPSPEALPKPRNADSNFRFELKEEQGDGDEQQQGQKGQQQQGQQQRQQDAAMRKNQAELEKARRDVQDLSRRLQQAAERLKQLEMSNAQGEFAKAQKMQQDMIAKAKAGYQFQNINPDVRIETRDGRIARVGPLPKPGPDGVGAAVPPGNNSYITVRRPPGRSANSEEDRDRRLDNVERQLSQLLNEVKRLRTDREKTPPTPSEPQAR